jgi:uncharacterized paraquat-inducible protein A
VDAPVLALRQQRCVNHPQREASARCPECGRFFCRECITEHDDRVLCAFCLARLSLDRPAASRWWSWLAQAVLMLLAFVVVFLAVLLFGYYLLSFPSAFHQEGGW